MLIYAGSFAVAAAALAVDQWTKFWVEHHMAEGEILPLLSPILELYAVHNEGAAWSIFSGARWTLVAVTAVMIAAVIAVLSLRLVRHPLGVLSGFLILAGGIGNLMDRLFLGYVVDMLHFPFWPSYPTFNVADICVVVGCGLWLIYILAVRENYNDVEVPDVRAPGGPNPGRPVRRVAGAVPDDTGGTPPGGGGVYEPWRTGSSGNPAEGEEDGDIMIDPRSDSSFYRRY